MSGSELNKARNTCFELTKMVHSEEEARNHEAAKSIFSGNKCSDNMPTTTISSDELQEGLIGILDLLVKSGLAPSKVKAEDL